MLALHYSNYEGEADLAHGDGALVDFGFDLETAVLLSLMLDAPAPEGTPVPDGATRRGWWADAFADDDSPPTGSLLWLIESAVCTEANAQAAKGHADAALKWLVDDQHVAAAYVNYALTSESIFLTATIVEKSGRKLTFPAFAVGGST